MAADVSASQTREDTPPPEPRKSSAASLKKEGSDLSQCSVQTWYSAQSLEEEYARNLQSAYSDATPAKSDSKASIVSLAGSKSSLKQETSESAVVEVQKKSNQCSIADKKSETSLKIGSGSTASFKDATTKVLLIIIIRVIVE